jgi:hypothetical protein
MYVCVWCVSMCVRVYVCMLCNWGAMLEHQLGKIHEAEVCMCVCIYIYIYMVC